MSARSWLALCAASCLAACGNDESIADAAPVFSVEALMNPETCRECHSQHYDEWSGSMHAYAATDPVFLAMNARGQAETGGKLGTFCVNCHAPMAVRTGAPTDPESLGALGPELRGVTCYFCHNVASVDGTHNAALSLAMDQRMRGPIPNPVKNRAHRAVYSPLMDKRKLESASLCGSCHDIVTSAHFAPADVELERTFIEWQKSQFNKPIEAGGLTCSTCHMRTDKLNTATGVNRGVRHQHGFPGVDIALGDFPQREAQRTLVQDFLDLNTIRSELCVALLAGNAQIQVTLENLSGHHFPSGAAQDRRVWVELLATKTDAPGIPPVYSSGVVQDFIPVSVLVGTDPDLWLFRDRALDAQNREVHMFWDAHHIDQQTIPGQSKLNPNDFSSATVSRRYPAPAPTGQQDRFIPFTPNRVTLRVRVRPIDFDVLDDLAASGNDPRVSEAVPTFDIAPERHTPDPPWPATLTLEWTPELAASKTYGYPGQVNNIPAQCVSGSPPRR